MILVWAAFLLWQRPNELKKRVFCALVAGQMIMIAGLRHLSVGPDTYGYKAYRFDPLLGLSWRDLLGGPLATVWGESAAKDPGYPLLVKAFQMFSQDYRVFLFFVAAAFIVPLAFHIYRYSKEPCLSFLIYACLFYNVFPETAMRQTIALSMVVLVGYRFIERRKLLPFLALALVASAVHASSVVFVPFYFISDVRFTWRRTLAVAVVAPSVYLLRSPLTAVMSSLLGYEQYAGQFLGAGAWVFGVMLVLVILAAMLRAPSVIEGTPHAAGWYNAVLIALLLLPVAFVHPVGMRVVQYYSFFLVLLVPAVVQSFRDKYARALVYLAVSAVLIGLFARTNPEYLFYWQGL